MATVSIVGRSAAKARTPQAMRFKSAAKQCKANPAKTTLKQYWDCLSSKLSKGGRKSRKGKKSKH